MIVVRDSLNVYYIPQISVAELINSVNWEYYQSVKESSGEVILLIVICFKK